MSQFKKKLTAFGAMLALLSLSSVASADSYLGGNATTYGHTGNMDINQSTDAKTLNVGIKSGVHGAVGQADWGKFNVGKDQTVFFGFSGLSQTIINRVLGGEASSILGKMLNGCYGGGTCDSFAQTGKVVLINPAGILFGAGSQVDINSFTASTFDFRGAKNLSGLAAAGLTEDQYLESLQNSAVFSALDSNGDPILDKEGNPLSYKYNRELFFDRNRNENFADIDPAKINHSITFEGTEFNDIAGNKVNFNKSIVAVSDNITYRDSLLKTGGMFNYNDSQSFGNVNLITADGVNYTYLANGYADKYTPHVDATTNGNGSEITRKIEIDNTRLTQEELDAKYGTTELNPIGFEKGGIESGVVKIENRAKTFDGSTVNISNTLIKANKLVAKENGDIFIVGSNGVKIKDSEFTTANNSKTLGGKVYNTNAQHGGEIYVTSGGKVEVENSKLKTAGATVAFDDSGDEIPGDNLKNAGSIRLISTEGTVDVTKNSKIYSDGNTELTGVQGVNVTNSIVYAKNSLKADDTKNVDLSTTDNINVTDSIVYGTGDVALTSALNGYKLGEINVTSTKGSTTNKTFVVAGGELSIQGTKTKIDNASLQYNDIKFYDETVDPTGTNDVTVANNSTFTKTGSDNIDLETNGNFKISKATLKTAQLTDTLNADGDVESIAYNAKDAHDISVTSTRNNIYASNNSNVTAEGSINLTANGSKVEIKSSTFTAKGTDENDAITLKAEKGRVYIKDSSVIDGANDVKVIASKTVKFGADSDTTATIGQSSSITAGHDLTFTSLAGNIEYQKSTAPSVVKYGNRIGFIAKLKNIFTSDPDNTLNMKIVNADFVAGQENEITSSGNLQLVESSLIAPKNTLKAQGGETETTGKHLVLNNVTIGVPEGSDANSVETNLWADGVITTHDLFNSYDKDIAGDAGIITFATDAKGETDPRTTETLALDLNGTVLKAETQGKSYVTSNTSGDLNVVDGSMDLNLKNANVNGVQLKADNVYTEDSTKDTEVTVQIASNTTATNPKNSIAVSKIVTDKLNIMNGTRITASAVTLSEEELAGFETKDGYNFLENPQGYIQVNSWKGFNQDTDFTKLNPNAFDYSYHFVKVENGATVDGELVDINKKHYITYGDAANQKFMLVYDRPVDECIKKPVIPDKTDETVTQTVNRYVFETNDPNTANIINVIKLPREQSEVSYSSTIADGTSIYSIMEGQNAAAAKVVEIVGDNNNKTKEEEILLQNEG